MRYLHHLPALLAFCAGLGFFLHAATAGRHRVHVLCTVEGVDNPVDLTLRRDAMALTALGITVTPDEGPPFVAETCEVQP